MTSQHTIEDVFPLLNKLVGDLTGLQERMDKRFDAVDQKFDLVGQRFTGVDQRLDGIDQRIYGIDQRLDGMQTDITAMCADITTLRTDLDDLAMATKEGFDSVDRRFDAMTIRMSRPWRRVWFD